MANKLLISCPNPLDANLVKAGLEDAGIHCSLENENFSSMIPLNYNSQGMGVRVMVADEDYEDALKFIESDNSNLIGNDPENI
jgi:hypothetical protein